MKLSIKGLTGSAAMLAAALGLGLLGPHRAYSAPESLTLPDENGLEVTILSPNPHITLTGIKPVEISAFYQGRIDNPIVAVDLYIDGAKAATKTLDKPETRGVISFLVDAGQMTAGTHKFVVRALFSDQEVKSARSAFVYGADSTITDMQAGASPLAPDVRPAIPTGQAPTLRLISPSENGKVRGVVTLHIEATDASGVAPYVSLFIDKTFKTLRNFAPYDFEWDTTAYPNGYHTIEAYGYNDTPNVGHSQALRLYVNNEGGNTFIRHDLLDGVKTVKPALSAGAEAPLSAAATPRKTLALPLPQRRAETPIKQAKVTTEPKAAVTQVRTASVAVPNTSLKLLLKEAPKPIAAAVTPTLGYKLLPRPVVAAKTVDPGTATLAAVPIRRVSPKRTRVIQIADIGHLPNLQLPENELSSPFLVVPHVSPITAQPQVKVGSYLAEIHLSHKTIKPVVKAQHINLHVPTNVASLLRAIGQTSVLFDHTTVKIDRPLTERHSILFGPLRQIFEQGGGTLTWQSRTGTVHAKNATKDIVLTIGKPQAVINSKFVALDGKPYLSTGRTMVPLSFVSLAMDANIQYDPATGHLLITSRK